MKNSERGATAAPAAPGATLTIDLDAVAANYRRLAERAGDAECAAVVKADGYGLGMAEVAAALAGPLTTAALCSWLRATPAHEAFPALPFTLLGTLTISALVRPLVHLGRLTPTACARSIAGAAASANCPTTAPRRDIASTAWWPADGS